MTTFSAVLVAKEDLPVIADFVAHYSRLGADEIVVYFDGPAGFSVAGLDPRLRFVECDEAFWQALGQARPEGLEERQIALYKLAVDTARGDWLLLVDSDERLVSPVPVAGILAKVPATVHSLVVPNAEAVWLPGDDPDRDFGASAFRRPMNRLAQRVLAPLVYGRHARFLVQGLAGYASGKQFVRARQAYRSLTIHHAVSADGGRAQPIGAYAPAGCFLAHYDAISRPRWAAKFLRRHAMRGTVHNMRPARARYVDAIVAAAAHSPARLDAVFAGIYALNRVQAAILKACGLLVTRPAGLGERGAR